MFRTASREHHRVEYRDPKKLATPIPPPRGVHIEGSCLGMSLHMQNCRLAKIETGRETMYRIKSSNVLKLIAFTSLEIYICERDAGLRSTCTTLCITQYVSESAMYFYRY